MKLTKQLNSTAVQLRTEKADSTSPEFDPYDSSNFSEFGPACTDTTVSRLVLPMGAAVPMAASIADIDSGDEADCIEVQESSEELEDKVECNELGDELEPRTKPVEQIFDQNVYWRSSTKVAGQVQFSAVADGSAQDVRFQQSFQEAQLEPAKKLEENEKVPSAFQKKSQRKKKS